MVVAASRRRQKRNSTFADILEDDPQGVRWHTEAETNRLLGLIEHCPPTSQKSKLRSAVRQADWSVAPIERTRDVQRAGIRFDDVAGCLQDALQGLPSRQTIMIVEGASVRSRLLSPREAARLMGLPDDYVLPSNYNEAYHFGG